MPDLEALGRHLVEPSPWAAPGITRLIGLLQGRVAGMRVCDEVRAGSGLFSGFVGKFVETSNGGAVGVITLEVMGAPFDYGLAVEDIRRVA